jgi:hypothetical protein
MPTGEEGFDPILESQTSEPLDIEAELESMEMETPTEPTPPKISVYGREYEDPKQIEAAFDPVLREKQQLEGEVNYLRQVVAQAQRPQAPPEQPPKEITPDDVLRDILEAAQAGQPVEVLRKLVSTAMQKPALPPEVLKAVEKINALEAGLINEHNRITAEEGWRRMYAHDPELAEMARDAASIRANPSADNIQTILVGRALRARQQREQQGKVVRGSFGSTGEAPEHSGGQDWSAEDEDKLVDKYVKHLNKHASWGG